MGQNQSGESPAHRDQNGQTTIQTKDEGSVLWVEAGVRGAEQRSGFYAAVKDAGTPEWLIDIRLHEDGGIS